MNMQSANVSTSAGFDNEKVKVLFIGNSITFHAPAPDVGWTGARGMASSEDVKDYVHIVTRGIEEKTGRTAEVKAVNVANSFERAYRNPDYDVIRGLAAFQPDYLVFAFGENVPPFSGDDDRLAFRASLEKLFSHFIYGRMQPNCVVRGTFWPNDTVDSELRHAASDYSFSFVKCSDLFADESMSATGLFSDAWVAAHPGDKGMAAIADRILKGFFPVESGYTALMDGKPQQIRPVRVSSMPFNLWAAPYQRPFDQTEIAGMINTEAEGETTWSVRAGRPFAKAIIRPLSSGVKTSVEGGEIRFALPGPGYYVLELDDEHSPLEIFVNRKRDFKKEKEEANIVFGPGLHEPVVVKLKSHDRVYIDKDAIVKGSFQIYGVEDVTISGYGTIDGGRNYREGNECYRDGMDSSIRIIDSKNIRIDGPVVTDSACWCVASFNSSDIEIAHLKVTGQWRYNTDGIDICNSQRAVVRDSYVHSFDDTLVVKGLSHYGEEYRVNDAVEDITFRNCVCWCSWGRTLENGYESFAPCFRNILFENCDLIHNDNAALSIHMGGDALLENIAYRNIRVEFTGPRVRGVIQTDRDQVFQPAHASSWHLVSITNDKLWPGFLKKDEVYPEFRYGNVDGLLIENITVYVDENSPEVSNIITPEEGTEFGRISIEEPVIIKV